MSSAFSSKACNRAARERVYASFCSAFTPWKRRRRKEEGGEERRGREEERRKEEEGRREGKEGD